MSVQSCKALGIALKITFRGDNQVSDDGLRYNDGARVCAGYGYRVGSCWDRHTPENSSNSVCYPIQRGNHRSIVGYAIGPVGLV
jgi:hypothetical protein